MTAPGRVDPISTPYSISPHGRRSVPFPISLSLPKSVAISGVMDLKSFSKSKGDFHHQQYQRSSRRPETSKSSKKKTQHQQNRVPIQGSHNHRALPSNWDRYDEEEEEESSVCASGPSSKPFKQEIVLPKSKGADYSYLISEAQSQLRRAPSFHDILLQDFSQGVSSMLSARGKGFLSWGADDNFRVDDDSSLDYEASFFSLDLDLLASELAKLEPSKRLFIEEEILPPSMRASSSKQNINERSKTVAISHTSESPQKQEQESLTVGNCCPEDTNLHKSDQFPIPAVQVAQENDAIVPNRHDVTYEPPQRQILAKNINFASLDCPDQDRNVSSTNRGSSTSKEWQEKMSNTMEKPATNKFEAAAVEAELDMLLDSFGETTLLDSFDFMGRTTAPTGSIRAVASSSSSKSPSPLSTSKVSGSFSGLSHKTSATTPLMKSANLAAGLSGGMLSQTAPSVENERKVGEKIGNPSLVSLDDFDEWLDSI